MSNQKIIHIASMAPTGRTSANQFKMLTPVKGMQERPDQFASFAHEIRNPLSTISLSTEMLKSIIIDDDQKKFLDMIIRGTERINDILTNTYATLRGNEVQVEKYSIHQLLEEVLAMAGDKINLKHITIRKDYDVKSFEIVMNGPKMKIALTNIIVNAIEAMTAGQGELTLTTRSTDRECVVQIEDNGCGISGENLENIFEPYFTSKPGGLGLGLATTLDILRANQVGLSVKSAEAKGTSFILVFRRKTSMNYL